MRKGTRGTQGPWTKVGHVAMGCQPACRDEKQPVAEMFALLAAFLARITRTQTCHVWRRFMVWSCTHQLRPVDIARQYFGVCGSGSTTAASASDTPLVCVDYPRSDGIPRLCPHHHPGRVGRVLPDVRAPGRGGRGEPRTRTRPSPTASPGSSGRESRLDTCVMGAGPAGPAVVKASAERNLPHAHLEWHAGPGGGMGISTAPAARCARPPSRCGRSGGCGRGCGSGNVRPGPALSGLRRPAESRRHGGGLARLNLFNRLGVITGCAMSGLLGSTGRFRLACAAQAALALLPLAAARHRRSSLHNSAWIRGTP